MKKQKTKLTDMKEVVLSVWNDYVIVINNKGKQSIRKWNDLSEETKATINNHLTRR